MPSTVRLNSSSQASRTRTVISNVDNTPDHLHPQTGGATATGSSAAANSRPFTSALDIPTPSLLLRPITTALRRRGSDGGVSSSRNSSSRHQHHRHHQPKSPSMDSPTEPHPLRRSSTTSRTVRYDDDDRGNTRPRLSRLLSPSEPVLVSARSPDDPLQPERPKTHRTVLAHEVLPNDTLAGVALRYGISVTELRRANQLWASDSIHLRQVLYVPLDKARHADLETVASLLAQRADSEEDIVPTAAPGPHPDPRTSDSSPFVRRIPSANLSFFPPPSSIRSSTPPPPGQPFASVSSISPFQSRSHSPAISGTHSRGGGPNLASSLRATNALSSLFSILPINASTRDEIMSRLSIDSVSNSTTGTASDDAAEHELTAVVPKTPKPKPRRTNASTSLSAPLAVHARRKTPAYTWLSESSSEPYNGYGGPYPRDVEQIALASSPIHTMQMQPAPTMQLPQSMTRSPPKGSGFPPSPPPPEDPHSDIWLTSSGDHRRTR